MNNPNNNVPPNGRRPRFHFPGWAIFMLILLGAAWFISRVPSIVSNMNTQAPIEVPYSVFRSQIEADNVSSILMEGTQVSGNFKAQVTWPTPGSAEAKQISPATSDKFTTIMPPID